MSIQSVVSAGALVLAILMPPAAHAGEFQYECVVRQVLHVDRGTTQAMEMGILNGQKFTISRETGDIVGSAAYQLNRAQGWARLEVLARGSPEQSFKMLAVSSGPYRNVVYVDVKEFEAAPQKTFLYYSNFQITTGTCR